MYIISVERVRTDKRKVFKMLKKSPMVKRIENESQKAELKRLENWNKFALFMGCVVLILSGLFQD